MNRDAPRVRLPRKCQVAGCEPFGLQYLEPVGRVFLVSAVWGDADLIVQIFNADGGVGRFGGIVDRRRIERPGWRRFILRTVVRGSRRSGHVEKAGDPGNDEDETIQA